MILSADIFRCAITADAQVAGAVHRVIVGGLDMPGVGVPRT